MKKTMFILMLFALVSLGSCSSDDDSNPTNPMKDLVLFTPNTTVMVNETVKFTVSIDGKEITDAEIYLNDAKIGYEYVFTAPGTYHVIAKKANTNNSNSIVIQVMENVITDPEPGKDSKYLGKWTPETITVSMSGIPIPGGSLAYPHQTGCDKDTVELLASYQAVFIKHDDKCAVTKQEQTWKENGTSISIPIMGIEIEGTVKAQTANSLTIETDIYKYKALVDQVFPEYSSLIVQGMKANIKLVK